MTCQKAGLTHGLQALVLAQALVPTLALPFPPSSHPFQIHPFSEAFQAQIFSRPLNKLI